jgi:energy-converting hydrogenase Eha subunit C
VFSAAGILLFLIMTNANISSRSRALLWWGVAALVIAAGYVDLARGGETIAPVLLVAGYLVFVPLAILRS